ncbi:hypothetical protein L9F63_012978, partial [Diploptera punctata]
SFKRKFNNSSTDCIWQPQELVLRLEVPRRFARDCRLRLATSRGLKYSDVSPETTSGNLKS